ncbi:MAG: helix-turn-helix domain-containing protein [Labilithrix sp.]
MTNLRSYGDPCGIARALDLVGERWSLLVVRELCFGPKRFTDLKEGITGASANVLSQRLRELEGGGVVRKITDGAAMYELTEWGRELHPILVKLGLWGAKSGPPPKGALSADALMVALESTFQPHVAEDLSATYDLRLGSARFNVRIASGRISVLRGTPHEPDATIETDAVTLRSVVFAGAKLADAGVTIRGDSRVGRLFFRLFARPARH